MSRVVTVVCTDKGTHPRRRLGWFDRTEHDDGQIHYMYERIGKRAEYAGTALAGPTGVTSADARLRCPTCRRDVPLRRDTMAQMVEHMVAQRLTRLDISLL